jgi:hypothetical protein
MFGGLPGAATQFRNDQYEGAFRRSCSNLGEVAHLDRESSNTLFEALAEWERHLASIDAKRLGCEHEHPKP